MLLGGHFAHQLSAKIFKPIGELDLLGDGDAVLGNARGAIGFLDHDISALGAERHLHGIIQNFDATQNTVACISGETDIFGGHYFYAPAEIEENSWKSTGR